MVGLGTPELVIIVVMLALPLLCIGLFIWWLLMLVEALRIPSPRWAEVGHSQLLLGPLGTLLYVLIPRKNLNTFA